jgi:hypothetical protein
LDEQLGKTTDAEEEAEEAGIEAGRFTDFINQRTWQQAINTAIDAFRYQFTDLYEISDPQITQIHGAGKERNAIALELLGDFSDFLKEKIDTYPGFNDSTRIIPTSYSSPGFYSAAKAEDTPEVAIDIEAARELDLTFKCELKEVVSAAGETAAIPKALANQLPIEGVLYYVDEVSEFAPSKGSEFPLYVPRDVAELAAKAINASGGLPLDADDSLGKHANEEIVGIMTSAEIIGNQFWVKGHLFPWNKQKKVALISANSQRLGMSMNAHAKTQPMNIDGQMVTYITSLDILGANILYAEKATYQKTKTVMAPQLISASNNNSGDEVEINTQLSAINDTLGALAKDSQRYGEILLQLEKRVASQDQELETLKAERQAAQEALAASRAEEAKKQEQQNLIAAMSAVVKEDRESLKTEIIESLGSQLAGRDRRRVPASLTNGLVDIVAKGNNANSLSEAQLELRDAKSALAALRQAGVVGSERAKLIEKISGLEAQLAN